MGAGGNQFGDDHGTDLRSFKLGARTTKEREACVVPFRRSTCPEILPFHFYGGLPSVRCPLALPEVREEIRDRNEKAERRLRLA